MADPGALARGTWQPLLAGHDLLLMDLDGVVYLGDSPIEHAAATLAEARSSGTTIAFVTNNASRTPVAVAAALRAMGVEAQPQEVTTAAMAAAELLAAELPPQSPVLVVGGEGLVQALSAAGLRPVDSAELRPVAVVQGWAPGVDWAMLAEAAVALRGGARWVAANLDATLPSPRGPLPGNGSLVAALTHATGRTPESVGKPGPALNRSACRRAGAETPLVVGDRLDTDVAGAVGAGFPSLLVLTGVTSAAQVVDATPDRRPDHIGRDLRELTRVQPVVRRDGGRWSCRRVVLHAVAGELRLVDEDAVLESDDAVDVLRASCVAAWEATDAGRRLEAASLLHRIGLT